MRNWIPLFMIILLSCETVIVPDLPKEQEEFVVYSFFRPGEPIHFDVFTTVSILSPSGMQRAKALTIDLYQDNQYIESITESISGSYNSATIVIPDKSYRFEISTADGKLVSQSTVPKAIAVEAASFSREIRDINLGEFGYPASLTFTDPKDEKNYYALEVFVDDCADGCDENGITGDLNELLIEDVKVNVSGNTDITIGEGPEGIEGVRYIYLSDNGFNGQTFALDFFIIPTLIDSENPSKVVIKYVLKSITEDYYEYLLTSDYQKQIEDEGILAEPVQVYTNVQNGLGVFAGYDISVFTLTLEE